MSILQSVVRFLRPRTEAAPAPTLSANPPALPSKARKRSAFPYHYPGITVFKRGNRQRPADPWLIQYRHPKTRKKKYETGSHLPDVTWQRVKAIGRMLDMYKLGLVDEQADQLDAQQRRPLLGFYAGGEFVAGHLDDYRAWLLATGRTKKRAQEVWMKARKMIRLCRWHTIADVTGGALEMKAGQFLLNGKRRLSPKTCNDYMKSAAQLTRWMARSKICRSRTNPLSDIELFNQHIDPRRLRRALTNEQFLHVLRVTLTRPTYKRMSASDRAMYYLLKVHTGFRNGEAASLTPESFDLASDPPTVTCEAAHSKHRVRDIQVIAPGLMSVLEAWLAEKRAGERIFHVDDSPCDMWRADLEAAGIAYCEGGRYADLYSLRHKFATTIARHPKASHTTVQGLMRHADPRTTQRYLHPSALDEQAILTALPMIEPIEASDAIEARRRCELAIEDLADWPNVTAAELCLEAVNRVEMHRGRPRA